MTEKPWRCVCGHFVTLHKDYEGKCLGFVGLHKCDDITFEEPSCPCEKPVRPPEPR